MLPSKRSKTPGLDEQVSISRATSLAVLAAYDNEEEPITVEQVVSFVRGGAYDKRRQFDYELWLKIVNGLGGTELFDIDPDSKTFDGGFDVVVAAYSGCLVHASNSGGAQRKCQNVAKCFNHVLGLVFTVFTNTSDLTNEHS